MRRKKGIDAARFLVNEKTDIALADGMGEDPLHLLRDNLVQTLVLPEQVELRETIHLPEEDKLERVTVPSEKDETSGM